MGANLVSCRPCGWQRGHGVSHAAHHGLWALQGPQGPSPAHRLAKGLGKRGAALLGLPLIGGFLFAIGGPGFLFLLTLGAIAGYLGAKA